MVTLRSAPSTNFGLSSLIATLSPASLTTPSLKYPVLPLTHRHQVQGAEAWCTAPNRTQLIPRTQSPCNLEPPSPPQACQSRRGRGQGIYPKGNNKCRLIPVPIHLPPRLATCATSWNFHKNAKLNHMQRPTSNPPLLLKRPLTHPAHPAFVMLVLNSITRQQLMLPMHSPSRHP